ncbi:MAG: hypothetical protein IJQ84_00590 [Paludibacteraceae bacterium]|nr:hypothetical protein [Paludibacteraceae bacterium]
MEIQRINSIQEISKQYTTGDAPVLVLCSDTLQYICKYLRANATIAYKLACEFIGAVFADAWKINTPPFALVQIMPAHWTSITTSHSSSIPAVGFQKLEGVIDITPTSFQQVEANTNTLYQILKIALFDFWIANEDRTYNNANLLYNIQNAQLISIDYGGILNNVTFDFPLSQLTETDSILGADIFAHICKSVSSKQLSNAIIRLQKDYLQCINCSKQQAFLLSQMPNEWAVPNAKVENKVEELFSQKWITNTWENFLECLKTNCNYGK